MGANLILLCRFSHDPRSSLAEVLALAFVRVELLLDSSLRFRLSAQRMMCGELHIAEFADPEHWNVLDAPNDPEVSLWHQDSLRRSRSRQGIPNSLHHYRLHFRP